MMFRLLGSQLLKFSFFDCDDIDATAELFPCSKLERLFINLDSTVAPISTGSSIPAEHFLPELKEFSVWFCSPSLLRLFESPRTSLTDLHVVCVHFGIQEASSYHWSDLGQLPQFWPNLKSLIIYAQSKSLGSVEDLRQMRSAIRKFQNFEALHLPEDLEEYGSEEVKDFFLELETELKGFQPNFRFICSSQGSDSICMYP